MKRNSPELWDDLWEGSGAKPPTLATLDQERSSVRWKRIRREALRHFGTIRGKSVVELGSGMGTYAALFAEEGATVTLVDYSPKALSLAQSFFETLNLKAHYVLGDIFDLKTSLTHSFDISVSCGVAEHFLDKRRVAVLDNHLDVLKTNGMTFVMVPNAANIPYRLYKGIAERAGFWPWGEEYPYHQSEFETFVKRHGIRERGFFGDSFLWSLNYFNPLCLLSKKMPRFKQFIIPQTVGTFLDKQYAYSLGFWAVRK